MARLNATAPRALFETPPRITSQLPSTSFVRLATWDYLSRLLGKSYRRDSPQIPWEKAPSDVRPSLAAALARRDFLSPPTAARFGFFGSFDRDWLGLQPRGVRHLSLWLQRSEETPEFLRLLRVGGVTHTVGLHDEGLEELEPVALEVSDFAGPVYLKRVPGPRPRVYAVDGARVADGLRALQLLVDPGFDPGQEIVKESGEATAHDPAFASECRLVQERPDRLLIEARLDAPGYVVALDAYDPGWIARLDGREVGAAARQRGLPRSGRPRGPARGGDALPAAGPLAGPRVLRRGLPAGPGIARPGPPSPPEPCGGCGLKKPSASTLLLVGLALWLFREALFFGGVFYKRDVHLVWHPQVEAFVRAVLGSAWPVWDPSLAFGQPLLADPSAQVLYPLTWLNLLMRPWQYYTLYAVLHFLLAAFGMRALARHLGLSPLAALVATGTWTLSGPYLSMIDLWHHYAGASWLPYVVLAADRALGGARRDVARFAVVLGLQVLAGSADLCAMTLLLAAALGVARHLDWKRPLSSANRAVLARGFGGVLLAVGLSAALWMAALEIVSRASRASLPQGVRTYWSLHPLVALETLLPGLFTSLPLKSAWRAAFFESREPFLASLYLGVGALALVAAAAAASRHPLRGLLLGVPGPFPARGSRAPYPGL